MTSRQLYEGALVELNKTQVSTLLLEDFVYWANKIIYQYINKRYNIYDINQQTSDDLRVLKATAILTPRINELILDDFDSDVLTSWENYEVILPNDYYHLLNCICKFKLNKKFKCYPENSYVTYSARRLTADLEPQIINNAYLKPSYKNPYYYINNINSSSDIPTNPYNNIDGTGTDMNGVYNVTDYLGNNLGSNSNLSRTLDISGVQKSTVERSTADRFGNPSTVKMEIRCGNTDSIFELVAVKVDYLKVPQNINLTQDQLDLTEDTSQILEFPDYVCLEIVNELVNVILENTVNPRIQTYTPVTQSISNPTQQ